MANIIPNPHTHGINRGITKISSSASSNWRIYLDGIDITAYLRFQAENMPNGRWLSGQAGIYPSTDLEGSESISGSFDLIEVANDLYAEGRTADAEKIFTPGLKKISIGASGPFQVSMLLYLKYSHLNR